MNTQFKNQNLQILYDVVNSQTVANLKTPNDIHAVLYPFIKTIINNPEALAELFTSTWYPLKSILIHLETKQPTFKLMPFEISMAFDLFMHVYH